jgi:hypothetical protein
MGHCSAFARRRLTNTAALAASAFFDVLEGKYREPVLALADRRQLRVPKGIAVHKDKWLAKFSALRGEERKATATL